MTSFSLSNLQKLIPKPRVENILETFVISMAKTLFTSGDRNNRRILDAVTDDFKEMNDLSI